MRVVIAEDEALLREGLARLLAEAGSRSSARPRTPDELLRARRAVPPDVAIVDIKMPPTHTDEGLVAAQEIRRASRRSPSWCSPTTSSRATRCASSRTTPSGRLPAQGPRLGRRGSRRRPAPGREGECVLDPTIVRRLVNRPRDRRPARRAHRARTRGPCPDGRRPLEPGDRRGSCS